MKKTTLNSSLIISNIWLFGIIITEKNSLENYFCISLWIIFLILGFIELLYNKD